MNLGSLATRADSSPIPAEDVQEAVRGIYAAQYLGCVLASLLLWDIGKLSTVARLRSRS